MGRSSISFCKCHPYIVCGASGRPCIRSCRACGYRAACQSRCQQHNRRHLRTERPLDLQRGHQRISRWDRRRSGYAASFSIAERGSGASGVPATAPVAPPGQMLLDPITLGRRRWTTGVVPGLDVSGPVREHLRPTEKPSLVQDRCRTSIAT